MNKPTVEDFRREERWLEDAWDRPPGDSLLDVLEAACINVLSAKPQSVMSAECRSNGRNFVVWLSGKVYRGHCTYQQAAALNDLWR